MHPMTKLATQADIHRLDQDIHVLKQDVQVLKQDVHALKQDIHKLEQSINRLAEESVKTNLRIDKLEQDLRKEMQLQTNRILATMDRFLQKAENYDHKSLSHGDILQGHEVQLRDHGRRLTALEAKY